MCIFSCLRRASDDCKYKILQEDCKCNAKTITILVGDNLHECSVCRKLYRCAYTYYCNFCTSKQPTTYNVVTSCYYCGFYGLTLSKQFEIAK